jgi:hypothetical protein
VLTRGDRAFAFQLEKVDRTKLYGYVETVVCDENNQPCELHTIASDGKSIVDKGGTALTNAPVAEAQRPGVPRPSHPGLPATRKQANTLPNRVNVYHFRWSSADPSLLEGQTARRRATLQLLQINHPRLVEIRRLLIYLGVWHG